MAQSSNEGVSWLDRLQTRRKVLCLGSGQVSQACFPSLAMRRGKAARGGNRFTVERTTGRSLYLSLSSPAAPEDGRNPCIRLPHLGTRISSIRVQIRTGTGGSGGLEEGRGGKGACKQYAGCLGFISAPSQFVRMQGSSFLVRAKCFDLYL